MYRPCAYIVTPGSMLQLTMRLWRRTRTTGGRVVNMCQMFSRARTALHTAEFSDRQGCACEGHVDLEHHLTRLYFNMLHRPSRGGFFGFLHRPRKVGEAARFQCFRNLQPYSATESCFRTGASFKHWTEPPSAATPRSRWSWQTVTSLAVLRPSISSSASLEIKAEP